MCPNYDSWKAHVDCHDPGPSCRDCGSFAFVGHDGQGYICGLCEEWNAHALQNLDTELANLEETNAMYGYILSEGCPTVPVVSHTAVTMPAGPDDICF